LVAAGREQACAGVRARLVWQAWTFVGPKDSSPGPHS
jgi:hypothetical protein